jgi:hypothetical protein
VRQYEGSILDACSHFISGETFASIPQEDQDLLRNQLGYMEQYARILGERIARFT